MISWPSPAKINLFLHITGQRKDGYHLLQTAVQFLEYGDTLQFDITDQPDICLLTPIDGVSNDDNLIIRAAKKLQAIADVHQGVQISIDKQLPMGGGLGGGSSNAATTLVALNQLWKCHLPREVLAKIGLELGADVPVFIAGHASWAEGVGEKLTAIFPPEPWYVVVIPDCHVSTAKIFSSPELTRDCEPITISRFLSGQGRNIFEDVVKKNYPSVAAAYDWLARYAEPKMTGTGACLFAAFENQQQAQQLLEKLPEVWQGFVAKGCNQSLLYNNDVI